MCDDRCVGQGGSTEYWIQSYQLYSTRFMIFNTSSIYIVYLLTRETVDLDPRVLRVEVARLEARHVEAGRGELVEGSAHRLLG